MPDIQILVENQLSSTSHEDEHAIDDLIKNKINDVKIKYVRNSLCLSLYTIGALQVTFSVLTIGKIYLLVGQTLLFFYLFLHRKF